MNQGRDRPETEAAVRATRVLQSRPRAKRGWGGGGGGGGGGGLRRVRLKRLDASDQRGAPVKR